MKTRRFPIAAIPLTCLIALTFAAQPTAHAQPGDPVPPTLSEDGLTSSDLAAMTNQDALTGALDQIVALGGAVDLVSSAIDDAQNMVAVYVHGVDDTVTQLINGVADATGVAVHIIAAPFSSTALDAAQAQVDQAATTLPITYVAEDPTGNGFTAYFDSDANAAAAASAVQQISQTGQLTGTAYDSLYSPPGGVPIAISASGATPDLFADRGADTDPWWGGARIITASGGCTSGWPMFNPTTSARFMSTAGHCTNFADGATVRTESGLLVGSTSGASTAYAHQLDATLIPVGRYSAGCCIYDGAWNTGHAYAIKGEATTASGQTLCQSGGVSGTRCHLRVVGKGVIYYRTSASATLHKLSVWGAQTADGSSAGGRGDSGSPVFGYAKCTTTCVTAHGILTGGNPVNYPASCTGIARVCSSVIYFADIKAVDSVLHVRVQPS